MNKIVDTTPTLPPYLKLIYDIYNSKKLSNFFDSDFLLKIFTLGNRKKLVLSVLREVEQSQNVLQIGATFGSQIDEVSKKVGYYGNYHLVDVCKLQLDRCKAKYKGINQNMNFSNQNGLSKVKTKYDVTIAFMLLHELPPKTREQMVNNLLDTINDEGKVVFIDYHKPLKIGFLTYLFKKFNQIYKPFVEDFWEQDISQIATKHTDDFIWRKSILADGFYQKVIAIKKTDKD